MQRTVITPPGKFNLPPLREMWRSREVAVRLAQRDLIVRYRQTIFGVTWVLAQPLVSAGIFAMVFGQIAGISTGDVPYLLFTLAGTLAWNLFSNSLGRSAGSLLGHQALVSKVFFPRLLVPISGLASVLLDLFIGLGLAVVLLFIYGINPGLPVLLLPLWIILITAVALGIGAALSAWMVKYRDINYILPWILQVLLYASPVAYPLSAVPADLKWIFQINPITWFLEAFRWSLIGTTPPELWQVLALVITAPVILFVGAIIFQRSEREFADFI